MLAYLGIVFFRSTQSSLGVVRSNTGFNVQMRCSLQGWASLSVHILNGPDQEPAQRIQETKSCISTPHHTISKLWSHESFNCKSWPKRKLSDCELLRVGSTTHQTLITVGSGMKGYDDGELPERELCEGQWYGVS